MYYFLKVKEQFISLHLIYIKHFMANNILLNYWINEAHWDYNYLLIIISLLVGCWQPGGISHNSRIMKEN